MHTWIRETQVSTASGSVLDSRDAGPRVGQVSWNHIEASSEERVGNPIGCVISEG